jgi:hypothetical protein
MTQIAMPLTRPIDPGDFVKAVFRNEATGEAERMWVRVEHVDDESRLVFGKLDSQPLVNAELRLGMELAIAYDAICEHVKNSEFGQ